MIIGINGRIGSGKDTIGKIIQYLVANNNLPKDIQYRSLEEIDNGIEKFSNWEIKKFAGKLKQIASLMTGIPIEKFEDQQFKNTALGREWCYPTEWQGREHWVEMTARQFLQRLGTEAIRDNLHTNAWVNALFADYIPFCDMAKLPMGTSYINDYLEYPNWIITDTRFPNEAQAIKDRGGIVIRVNRENPVPLISSHFHPSETALDDWKFDYVIENDGSIEELIEKVKKMCNNFKII